MACSAIASLRLFLVSSCSVLAASPALADTINVPADFPTIQAAIDSVAPGASATVQVAAGTYNESFGLNGKNIVVRGAAKGGTVLSGTGVAGSIARFSGGEPATAGLEALVFRNGVQGSVINPPAPVAVGGAVFGVNSAAFIRNCRFEDCGADFGGAVYLFGCSLAIDGCVFDGNEALIDGGAMLAFRCEGVISGSSFSNNLAGLASSGSGAAIKTVGGRTAEALILIDGCSVSGNRTNVSGSAIEHFEDAEGVPGVMRISGTSVSGNQSGFSLPNGAGGLRVLGAQRSCVLAGGTSICGNTARNVSGPYLIEGAAEVCDCEADVFENGVVDAADLGILLSSWGLSGSAGAGDLNHDGLVNALDLAELLSSWGSCG
ncbi:MAG: hypothetical protein ACKO0W_05895 [Planctomycetota bacterium]